MASWRFYQGLRSEWRWYHFDPGGEVIAVSDQGFAELPACMANAETAGFTGDAYQVHLHHAGDDALVEEKKPGKPEGKFDSQGWSGSPPGEALPPKEAAA